MVSQTKQEAENNGIKTGADGNQKIDSMMVKPESAESKEQNGHSEKKEPITSTKRDTVDLTDDAEERPAKAAKKEEKHESANGDAEKASKPADKEQAETLKPGNEEEMQGDQEGAFKVLERGHIFFFYRPKVQSVADAEKTGKSAGSIDDVQNTHMLLLPQASESPTAPAPESTKKTDSGNAQPSATTGEKAKKQGVGFRLIKLGKKRLPAPEEAIKSGLQPGGIGGDSSEAIWACVSDIGPNVSELSGKMGEQRYNTRTRGERVVGASRPVGRGWYAFTLQETDPPSSRSVKLIYALSHPSDMGDVQVELGLSTTGCIALSMRNPTTPSNGSGGGAGQAVGLDDSAKVQMSEKELGDTFGGDAKESGTRWARPENVELLDREGVELLLTKERAQSTDNGASKGAGEDQADALKSLAEADTKRLSVDDVFAELQMSTSKNPPEALQGDWI